MTVARLEAEMTHREMIEWMALASIDAKEAEQARLASTAHAGLQRERRKGFGGRP